MKKIIVISTSLRHGSNSNMLAEKLKDHCDIYEPASWIKQQHAR